jgi:NAD(P)-dependent dehydrogenase (short-subunit alcohol dehydrogenase family)
MSLENWDLLLRLMLTGPTFLPCKYGIPELIKAGHGAILQISSTQAVRANRWGCAYTAAKSAQIALMRHMALHYAPQNIRCNALALGVIAGPSTAKAAGVNQLYARVTPLGSGRPDDVADAAMFLCSKRSRFITGETLVVDGGLTIYMPGNYPDEEV